MKAKSPDRQIVPILLVTAGRLLLEYNESSDAILRTLEATARAVTDEPCQIDITYQGVAVSSAEIGPPPPNVSEFRNNVAAQMRVHQILHEVRLGTLDTSLALSSFGRIEEGLPRHPLWLVALLLGATAASLSQLLGADRGAAVVVAFATTLGFVARRLLGSWHVNILLLPLTAALIGAIFGGVAIHHAWTRSAELVLVVPTLMVVPGPHLINAIIDLLDNQVPMCLFRAALAAALLFACALGIILGIEMTLPATFLISPSTSSTHLNLASDMVLAGVATCGFAVFYNVPVRYLWLVVAGGMAGHGLRFLSLEADARPEAATLLGGLAVGVVSAWMARRIRSPVSAVAFAGAVTMIPGLSLFRALAGARQLAFLMGGTESELVARTLGHAFQSILVLGGLGLGLIVGARVTRSLLGERSYIA